MEQTERPLAEKVLAEVANETTRIGVAEKLIRGGYGNVAVLYALIQKFGAGEDKSRTPEIYRAKLVERGVLTPEQARATRGPSIPRQLDEAAALCAKLREPGVDLAEVIASMPESRTGGRRAPRVAYVHRTWIDGTACGEPSERVAENLGDVTCPRCLGSFEGWWGPDGTCPECERQEVDGHTEDCGLVTGESELADAAPYARGAPGPGATRRPFLLARKEALHDRQVRDETARLARMAADLDAQKAKVAAMQGDARVEVTP